MEKPSFAKLPFAALILAAGKGTRMRSALPKVLHPIAGRPMIAHVLHALQPLAPQHSVIVLAPGMDTVQHAIVAQTPNAAFATQETQEGTGHAVSCGMQAIMQYQGVVLVVYGDTPLITPKSLHRLLQEKLEHKAAIALLGMRPADPTGYGRLLMPTEPYVERIIECKDATPEQKRLPWVWGGVMAFDAPFLRDALTQLAPSPVTGEYYLTALVDMASRQGLRTVMTPMSAEEAMGINDRAQLAEAEQVMQQRLRLNAMKEGATLMDPASIYLQADTRLGCDVIIHPHVVFGPKVTVEDGVEIRSFSHIEGAHIERHAVIGPFARLRPGSYIGEEAHVGNFVELKQSRLGKGAKANHLSYIGDSEVGEAANIGAGTITCNYDGVHKHKTYIGARAFVGSNSSLVAPVSIGEGAIIGAGSVISQNVEADALALTRTQQTNKPGKALEMRKK